MPVKTKLCCTVNKAVQCIYCNMILCGTCMTKMYLRVQKENLKVIRLPCSKRTGDINPTGHWWRRRPKWVTS